MIRLVRTALNHDPRQLGWWLIRSAQDRLPFRVPEPHDGHLLPPPAYRTLLEALHAGHAAAERADLVRSGRFRFLGHEEALGDPDWNRRYVSHLWSFHLHYFDYAPDLAATGTSSPAAAHLDTLLTLTGSWSRDAVPGRSPGWEPYPIAVRTLNWLRALVLAGDRLPAAAQGELARATAAQLCVLERRLEYHRRGNHLQKNYQALAFGGLLLGGADAARWRRRFVPRFWNLVLSHFLPDGGHYERSVMYHSHALRDALETAALQAAVGVRLEEHAAARLKRALHALRLLSRPDGSLHAFNDGSAGDGASAHELDVLRQYAGIDADAPAPGPASLPDSGFFTWRSATGDCLVVDCGVPGPREQPAHVHCDMLSYELDVAGRPIVVDSGTSGYAGDPLREYARSTRAHNTVQAGDDEQTEVWGTFRVARMARPVDGTMEETAGAVRFSGACRHAGGRATHHRKITGRGRRWRIEDRVDGATGTGLRSYVHLAPDFVPSGPLTFASAHSIVHVEPFGVDGFDVCSGSADPWQGWYSPRFGSRLPAPVITLRVDRNVGSAFGYTISIEDR